MNILIIKTYIIVMNIIEGFNFHLIFFFTICVSSNSKPPYSFFEHPELDP